jgi:hypothetical protein
VRGRGSCIACSEREGEREREISLAVIFSDVLVRKGG